MATRIEILASDRENATAAFYYVVPVGSRLAGAADVERVAAGSRLSAQELQDLKDGALIEVVRTFSTRGMTAGQARTRLQNTWAELEAAALADYTARYRFSHLAWDGTAWS